MVYLLLGNGFEEMEAIAPCDILRRGGVEVKTAGIGGKMITGSHGITVEADITVEEICLDDMEMLILPGGLGGVQSIRESRKTMDTIAKAWADGKYVSAICAAPTVLAELGITHGKRATCYPGMEEQMGSAIMTGEAVSRDGNVICGQAAGAAMEFGFALLSVLRDEETAANIRRAMVCPE